jgi:hypothetical protein
VNDPFMRAAAALLLAAAALAGGACGDDDDGTAGGDDAAVAEFTAGYEEVTASFEERAADVQEQGRAALQGGGDATSEVYRTFLEVSVEARDAYAALEPPAALRPAFERLVAALDDQAAALETVIEAAAEDDDPRLTQGLDALATAVVEVTNARLALDRQRADQG